MSKSTTLQEVEKHPNSNESIRLVYTERSYIIILKRRSKLKHLIRLPRIFFKQFMLLDGISIIERISLSLRLTILVLKD